VALEMLQATKIGGTALTPEHRASRTPGRMLDARGSARGYGAQSHQPGYRDELASFHKSRPRQSLTHADRTWTGESGHRRVETFENRAASIRRSSARELRGPIGHNPH